MTAKNSMKRHYLIVDSNSNLDKQELLMQIMRMQKEFVKILKEQKFRRIS